VLWVNKRPSKAKLYQVYIDKKEVIPDKWRNALITYNKLIIKKHGTTILKTIDKSI